MLWRSSAFIFYWIFFILAGYQHNNKSLDGFELQHNQPHTVELAAFGRLEKST